MDPHKNCKFEKKIKELEKRIAKLEKLSRQNNSITEWDGIDLSPYGPLFEED